LRGEFDLHYRWYPPPAGKKENLAEYKKTEPRETKQVKKITASESDHYGTANERE
jgi:hypothetical protein